MRGFAVGASATDQDGDVEQALVDSTTGDGMSPDDVATLVIDAVRTGQFYIGTKPSFADQVTQRTEAVLARRLPAMPDID